MYATYVLWNKQMRKFLGSPMEMFGFLIQPILWVVLFGVGMRSLMSEGMPGAGDNYVTYMLPGIVALSALGGAIGGGSVWLTERLRGIVKEYLAAPISRISILLGNASSVMTKSLFQAVIILIVGVLIGADIGGNVLGLLGGLGLLALFGLGFSGLALSMATRTDNPGAYHAMIMVFNLPMLFLSNALYPLNTMPAWLRIGSLINPTTYTIDGIRQMMFNNPQALAGGEPLALWLCWLVVGIFAVLGMWMAYSSFIKSLK